MKRTFTFLLKLISTPVLVAIVLTYYAAVLLNRLRGRPHQPYATHITIILVRVMQVGVQLYLAALVSGAVALLVFRLSLAA
jgi:hypothetical protein